VKPFLTVISIVALLLGGTALLYAKWTGPIVDGDAAVGAGQLERALTAYAAAESRFDRLPAARQLFARDYTRVVGNQLWALYQLGRYDDAIDRAERAPEGASPHLWSGCAFFQKAVAEEKAEARLGWLTRAEEELRKAVEAAPGDWDTKYDFELTTRLASELRKQPKTPPRQLMQLLRQPQPTGKPTKRVG
jgi:tetratricopeptide (TPR) repeat protein